MKKMISRKDAAEILGVNPQTISNYAERGIIHERRARGHCFYHLAEIESLAECPGLKDTEQIQAEICKMQEEIREQYTLTYNEYNLRVKEFHKAFGDRSQWERYRQIVMTLVQLTCDDLTVREKGIISRILDCDSFDHIAHCYGISYERTRQVFMKGLRKMLRYSDKIQEREKRITDAMDKLQSEKNSLMEENERLKLALIDKQADAEEKRKESLAVINSIELYRTCKPFTIPLADIGLSVRAFNCCKSKDIRTIGELVSFKQSDLMKLRNFGRKSMNELEELLARYGLRFGMWRDPQRQY